MMDTWIQLPEKLKSGNYDQLEHSTWTKDAEAWSEKMHKLHREYKDVEQRREELLWW
jgi:hypothetical protein